MRNPVKSSKASMALAMASGILVMTLGTPAFAGTRFARPDFAPILHMRPDAPIQVPPSRERSRVKDGQTSLSSPVLTVIGMVKEALDEAVGAVQTTLQSTVGSGAGCNDDPTPF